MNSISNKLEKKSIKVIGYGFIFILVVFGIGLIVNLLWNWLMPEIFGLTKLSYLQSLGILVLSKILFGSIGSDNDQKKSDTMEIKRVESAPEEVLYEKWWTEYGEESFENYMRQKETKE